MSTQPLWINTLLGLLLRKTIVPTTYHDRVNCVQLMLQNDTSGLIDSLTDFMIDAAMVEWSIETESDELNNILRKWLETINLEYEGKVPVGIKALAREYFYERWKNSSFPVLKVTGWKPIKGVKVPNKMFFVDGGSIYSKKKKNVKQLTISNYDYYLGSEMKDKLDKGVLMTRPYGRWFDEYPTPFLIKRGIYENWKILNDLKEKEIQVLEQVLPYLLLIKKGTEALARENIKTYSDQDLTIIKERLEELQRKLDETSTDKKRGIRVTQFDEEIKHLIPDLKAIFDTELFAAAERHILSGLGFIDVVEATSTSRRESILNPKAFIEHIRSGVKDFKEQILQQLLYQIVAQNKGHRKYFSNNTDFYICHSAIKGFMTDNFKQQIQRLWRSGRLSDQTAVELVAETDFRTEVYRRRKETKEGLPLELYPPVSENREDSGIDIPGEKPEDTDENGKPISEDKIDEVEKKEYDIGRSLVKCPSCKYIFDMTIEKESHMGAVKCPKCGKEVTQENLVKSKHLEGAPYQTVKNLPPQVKNSLSKDLQSTWMRIFNNAYQQYKNETRAFRVAWSVIKKIAYKNKKGIWVRRKKKVNGKIKAMTISKEILKEALIAEEEIILNEEMEKSKKLVELEIAKKQSKLLDNLLKKGKHDRKEK